MAIEVRGLVKSFGDFRALSGLSFAVPRGRIAGFLGPNGSGKTTTLKLLLGLLRPDSGTVKLLGEEIRGSLPLTLKRKIGYLPEEPVFPEQLTGREILALVGENYNLKDAARGPELLALFGLERAAARKVAGYSRGMKQKLGLAAALLPNPELLILDEPVSALDPVGRRQALELLAALKGKTTVLFSSHILTDVERICQQVVVIKEGRKLADERLTELLSRYGRVCCLKVAGDQKLAQSILRSDEAVAALKTEGERLLATVKPGCLGSFRTRTLQRLLAAGLELCELAPDGEQLERILLKILAEGEQDHEMRLGTEKGLA